MNFEPGKWVYVCSNHFVDGEPTSANPNPTLYLRQRDSQKKLPRKRRRLLGEKENEIVEIHSDEEEIDSGSAAACNPSITFEQLTREHDIRFYTGFINGEIFKTLFNHLSFKASSMRYWDGSKKTFESSSYSERLDNLLSSPDINVSALNYSASKPGPSRKLSLETEFFMTLMKLRLDLLQLDLANRFGVGVGKVSQIFITWIKLLSKELGVLVIWPSKDQVRKNLPLCFKKLYPKVRTIIDFTEVFTETPSSLEAHNLLWSDYKHHTTIKFLVCITPNGSISWVSPAYGGRTSDVHIVQTSGFLKMLEPYDQIMADRGFKIKTILALYQCTLAIPPSGAKGVQFTSAQSKETSTVANVRIYVEQAIKNLKDYRILKTELQLLYLPIVDDIIRVCCALHNLKKPLKV